MKKPLPEMGRAPWHQVDAAGFTTFTIAVAEEREGAHITGKGRFWRNRPFKEGREGGSATPERASFKRKTFERHIFIDCKFK